MNLPNYEFLSAPIQLITVLHLLTLSLHFLAMNLLLGGVIIVLIAGIRKQWDDPTLVKFVKLFPVAMAATITLGIAPLLFLQLVYHRQVYAAAIVSGWFWLLVPAVALVVYYLLYRTSLKGDRTGKLSVPALLVALAGLLYISLVYSSVLAMAERPKLIHELYAQDQSGWVWNPAIGSYLLRWLHMILGALAVGGYWIGAIGKNSPVAYQTGKRFYVTGVAVAAVAGSAYLMTVPGLMQTRAIWVLGVGILSTLGSLHLFFKKKFCLSGMLLLGSMLTMVYARHMVRLLRLADTYRPDSMRFMPQWGPFGMFLICFVVVLVVVAYMVRLLIIKRSAELSSSGAAH